MKTAGVITFHSAYNYGASLQTWALQEALKKLGVKPCVINYHPEIIDRLYRPPVNNTIKKKLRYAFKKNYRNIVKSQWEKDRKYKAFFKNNFEMLGDFKDYESLKAADLGLDIYITGSDQVWNSDHIGGFDPAYYLEFAPKGSIKLSYAASVGREVIQAKYKESIKAALKDYTAISVREESAKPAVSELSDVPVEVVIDPTLLLTRKDYDEKLKKPVEKKDDYILVYMMENNEELIAFANKLSYEIGLPIIQRRAKKVFKNELKSFYTDTPDEFISELENARYVLTNSFHGTVFSIIYEKPFVSMLHTSTGSRTIDLLKAFGLEEHILYSTADFNGMAQFEIKDVQSIRKRHEELRNSSYDFLKKALKL